MQLTVVHPDTSDQDHDSDFDDIEWELCCSAREASLGFVPFANLDFAKVVMELSRKRAEQAGTKGTT